MIDTLKTMLHNLVVVYKSLFVYNQDADSVYTFLVFISATIVLHSELTKGKMTPKGSCSTINSWFKIRLNQADIRKPAVIFCIKIKYILERMP